jgi:hypothetical protein
MIVREGQSFLFPEGEFLLKAGDALLLAGRHVARTMLHLTLQNTNALDYIVTGKVRRKGLLRR